MRFLRSPKKNKRRRPFVLLNDDRYVDYQRILVRIRLYIGGKSQCTDRTYPPPVAALTESLSPAVASRSGCIHDTIKDAAAIRRCSHLAFCVYGATNDFLHYVAKSNDLKNQRERRNFIQKMHVFTYTYLMKKKLRYYIIIAYVFSHVCSF